MALREARLKAEFARRYPGLAAGVWLPAAQVAEYFLAQPSPLPNASTELTNRVLDETHFDFRGGDLQKARSAQPTRRNSESDDDD